MKRMINQLLALLLFAQSIIAVFPEAMTQEVYEQLERERFRAKRSEYSNAMMFTVIAERADGRGVRGRIGCEGPWYKMGAGEGDDPGPVIEMHPFKTDARGAIILNPYHGFYGEGEWTRCEAWGDDGERGSTTFMPEDGKVFRITVR